MTEKEILEKAIEKAINNGYELYNADYLKEFVVYQEESRPNRLLVGLVLYRYRNPSKLKNFEYGNFYVSYESIIFSKGFAKAFWGEEEIEVELGMHYQGNLTISNGDYASSPAVIVMKACDYHRVEMVLEANPIKYLERFI